MSRQSHNHTFKEWKHTLSLQPTCLSSNPITSIHLLNKLRHFFCSHFTAVHKTLKQHYGSRISRRLPVLGRAFRLQVVRECVFLMESRLTSGVRDDRRISCRRPCSRSKSFLPHLG